MTPIPEDLNYKINKIDVLEESMRNWQATTIDYRKQLCDKIDEIRVDIRDIRTALDKLPCDKRWAWWQSMNTHIKILWFLTSSVLISVVISYFKK